ncbi:MAG: hypothetical protein JO127_07605 [Caulobacteraceae bacterium]|nr:hypothetical protein [Caulobacteraceae bacterium]
MRLLPAIAVVALTAAVGDPAAAQEDRYGPFRPEPAPTAGTYDGPFLNWPGKGAAPVGTAPAPPPAPTPAPAPAPLAALPPPEAAPASGAPPSTIAEPPARAASPALAQNTAAPAAAAGPARPSVGVRFYSVLRDYGMQPDRVETPVNRPLVLIGPPDGGAGAAGSGGDASPSRDQDRRSDRSDTDSSGVY